MQKSTSPKDFSHITNASDKELVEITKSYLQMLQALQSGYGPEDQINSANEAFHTARMEILKRRENGVSFSL
jgi:DNA-binding GntR family transcriptional regulator